MRVGVDEAGKGPVLGPMVAAAVRGPVDALPDGVDDSKRLTATRRESLADEIRNSPALAVGVATVEPARIDAPGTDMNALTVAAQVEAVRTVVEPGDRVVADAGDVSEARFARRLRAGVVGDGARTDDPDGWADLVVEAAHGADADDFHVAAASVVAKVERDAAVAAIDATHDHDVGSGYPSDPTTRSFLADYVAEHGDVPPSARRSWATCADVLAAAEQSALGDF